MKEKFIRILFLFFIVTACRKDQPVTTMAPAPDDARRSLTVDEVKTWFESQKDTAFNFGGADIAWDKVQPFKTDTGIYLLAHVAGQPSFKNIKQGYRKLLFKRDRTGTIEALLLEIIPDALYLQRARTVAPATFTGRVFVYDRNYRLKNGLVFVNGKEAGSIKPRKKSTDATSPGGMHVNLVEVVENCAWHDSYYVNANGEAVIYSERICTYDVIDGGDGGGGGGGSGAPAYTGSGGGGGGTSASAPPVSNLPGETNPKINPKSYMDCFSNLPDIGSKMTITIFVQEPEPGLPFNVGRNSVGHTAIGLTKTYNGASITQVVGFYPDATGKDKIHAPAKILDNSGLSYNVSISYTVIASEFNKVAAFIGNPPATYDITNYNCTNFAYNACKAGGITLPNPMGNMGMAQTGMTPAALGGSIRKIGNIANTNLNGGSVDKTKGPCIK